MTGWRLARSIPKRRGRYGQAGGDVNWPLFLFKYTKWKTAELSSTQIEKPSRFSSSNENLKSVFVYIRRRLSFAKLWLIVCGYSHSERSPRQITRINALLTLSVKRFFFTLLFINIYGTFLMKVKYYVLVFVPFPCDKISYLTLIVKFIVLMDSNV